MSRVCTSSETKFGRVTSSVLVTVVVVGVDESIKMGVENGTEIRGSETRIEIFSGRGEMVIGIIVVIRDDVG